MPAKITSLDEDNIVQLYRLGTSTRAIAERCGVSITPVYRILRERGIVRTVKEGSAVRWTRQSERDQVSRQMVERWNKATKQQRSDWVTAAHKAATGRKHTHDEKVKRAAVVERRQLRISALERRVLAYLLPYYRDIRCQTAVGPYNCDFTVDTVAVEVWGGGWHWHGEHIARTEERFRYIMDRGWDIIVLAINNRRRPLTPRVTHDIVTHIDELRRDPSPVRQYRVIWCGTDFTTSGRANDDNFSVKTPFTSRRNPATGQYETIPR